MGYKTIYCQVICCYAKHCRLMVKNRVRFICFFPAIKVSLSKIILWGQIGFCSIRYRFS